MTSKNSSSDNFFKSQQRLFGRRMACMVISCLVWFFTFPVGTALALLTNGGSSPYTIGLLSSMVGIRSWTFVFTAISAFVLAIQGISWLFTRQKVDFYESLPVKRTGRFRAVWINSFLIWLIPFAVFSLGTLAWLCASGILSGTAFADLGAGMVRQSLLFMTVYAMTTAFGLLTGNAVSAVILAFIFNVYVPVLSLLGRWLQSDFFATWTYHGRDPFQVLTGWLIPVVNYYSFGQDIEGQTTALILKVMIRRALPGDLRNLVLFLLFTLFALCLYKNRKNEMAEVTLAFGRSVPLIMILLLVPGMLLVGIVIHTMLGGYTGVIFGACLLIMLLMGMSANCLMEAYIEGDIRFAFRRFWAFLLAGALSAGIFGAFFFDAFGYDRYIPSEEKLEGVVILPEGRRDLWKLTSAENYDPDTYPVPLITDKRALELARISQEARVRKEHREENENGWDAYVSYIGKNGKIRTRAVWIPENADRELMDSLLADPAFRRQLYPALDLDRDRAVSIYWNSVWKFEGEPLTDEAGAPSLSAGILDAYERDLEHLNFEEFADGKLTGTLNFSCKTPDPNESFDDYIIPVYECCSETAAILEECGIDLESPSLQADQISYIEITRYGEEWHTESYTDPDRIREITENLSGINTYYEIPFAPVYADKDDLSVMIYWKDGREKKDGGYDYRFIRERVPDFVKEDFPE